MTLRTDEPRFALCLLARHDGRGAVCGYFFGPALDEISGPPSQSPPRSEAVMVRLFGDLRLVNGSWPILGRAPDWDPDRWPMATFGRKLNGKPFEVDFDPKNFAREASETAVSLARYEQLPPDKLAGAGFVEITLTRLLADATSPA